VTPYLIDKVMTARLGHGATGAIQIAGLTCHRSLHPAQGDRAEDRWLCWWQDASGTRHGDA
jgi:hypothetical protein